MLRSLQNASVQVQPGAGAPMDNDVRETGELISM